MAFFEPKKNIFQQIGGDFVQGAKNITDTVGRGAAALTQGSTPGKVDSFGTMLGKTGALLSTGLQTAGAVAGAALSPINRGIGAIAQPIAKAVVGSPLGQKVTDNKTVQNVAMKAGNAIDSVKQNHPEFARNVGAAANIAALLGTEAAYKKATAIQAAPEYPRYTVAETNKQLNNHFATADQILKDPDMAGNVPMNQLLERTKTNIVDDLTKGAPDLAKDVNKLDLSKYANIDDFKADVKSLFTNKQAENFVAHPEAIPLYRGESMANKGGVHFTPDSEWSNNFGKTNVQGSLPAGSKVFTINDQSMQEALQQGITNDDQFYKWLFDKGYDALLGSDSRNSNALDIVVNPKLLNNFKVAEPSYSPPVNKFFSPQAEQEFYDRISTNKPNPGY